MGGGARWFKSPAFYLLCAGAFVSSDYNRLGFFKNRCYKWGYFPEVKEYKDIKSLVLKKEPASILWAGRLIDWKHPEIAIKLAQNLKIKQIKFKLKIIGSGKMSSILYKMINDTGLNDCVDLAGAMTSEDVRANMERSQIFLFTSDRGEGWGAVLNEAMSSACAVVAGEKIGSVPFLISHGQNGLIFKDKDINDLTELVEGLLSNTEKITRLGSAAYETVSKEWSPKVAAERFITLAEALKSGRSGDIFSEGPCSPAPAFH